MKKFEIILNRSHFPKSLNEGVVKEAYMESPCIMEKAIKEQYPNLNISVSGFGLIFEGKDRNNGENESIGEIKNWNFSKALDIVKELRKNRLATFSFKLNIK